MSWNRSDVNGGGKPASRARSHLLWYGAAGVALLVLVMGAALLVFRNRQSADTRKLPRKGGLIEEASPRVPNKPRDVREAKTSNMPSAAESILAGIADRPKPKAAARPISPEEWNRLTNRVFKTGTDQLISWVCQVTPGDMPIPIPRLGEEEKKDIIGILLSKIPTNEKDDERLANLKADVNFAKKEMAAYIADGGDPDEFLQYYFNELRRAFESRNQVIAQIEQLYDEGDKELAREFHKKANELLSDRGIKTVPLSQFEDDEESKTE